MYLIDLFPAVVFMYYLPAECNDAFVIIAGRESQNIHKNSARNEHFFKLGTVVCMGLKVFQNLIHEAASAPWWPYGTIQDGRRAAIWFLNHR